MNNSIEEEKNIKCAFSVFVNEVYSCIVFWMSFGLLQIVLFSLKCGLVCKDCFYIAAGRFKMLIELSLSFSSHQFREILSYKVCKVSSWVLWTEGVLCHSLHFTGSYQMKYEYLSYNWEGMLVLCSSADVTALPSLHHTF